MILSGGLLTGYNAPRKNNLRQFLEKNPIGTKVIFNDKPSEKVKKVQRPSKSLTLSSRHREQKEKDEKKKQRPIAKIQPITKQPGEASDPFPGQTQTRDHKFHELYTVKAPNRGQSSNRGLFGNYSVENFPLWVLLPAPYLECSLEAHFRLDFQSCVAL